MGIMNTRRRTGEETISNALRELVGLVEKPEKMIICGPGNCWLSMGLVVKRVLDQKGRWQ